MLFGNGSLPSLAVLKHVAEILFKDDYIVYGNLRKIRAKEIEQVLLQKGIEFSSNISALLAYLKVIGVSEERILIFRGKLSEYLLTFEEYSLPYEYLVVPDAIRAAKLGISRGLRKNNFNIFIDEQNWTELLLDFSGFVKHYTTGNTYDPESNGIIQVIYRSAEFYSKEIPYDILRNLTARGMNQEIEGEDYDSSDFQTEELFIEKDYDRFDILASNIYNVTDFLYRHNNQIYYDLFSRYKMAKVEKHAESLKKEMSKAFGRYKIYSNIKAFDPNFVLRGGRSSEAVVYAQHKRRDRDMILSELDAFIEGRADLSDLSQTINNMLSINEDIVIRTRGKDKRAVFDTDSYFSRDKLSNDDKLERLFRGMVSLKKFIEYLRENYINVFSVSSAIFRDQKLIKRFPKFSRYMTLLNDTKNLIEEEENDPTLISNDEVYDDLVSNSANVINNIPLRSIKDVIDSRVQVLTPKKEEPELNVLDKPILERARLKLESFYTSVGVKSIPGIYATEHRGITAFIKYFIDKGILVKENEKWKVNPVVNLENILTAAFSNNTEKVNNVMLFVKTGPDLPEEHYLSFLRSFEFMTKFLNYIEEVLGLLYVKRDGTQANIYSKFRLFLVINDNKKLFDIPAQPINYTEFSDMLDRYDFEYYLGSDGAQDINGFLIKWYRIMYKEFQEFLDYIKSLSEGILEEYVSGVSFEKSSSVPIEKLKSVGIRLYQSPKVNINDHPSFEKFKYLSGVDEETGFLKKGKTLYREERRNSVRYLHETGYWVSMEGNNVEFFSISKDDVFGG